MAMSAEVTMTQSPSSLRSLNRLLAILPPTSVARIDPLLAAVPLTLSKRLLSSGLVHDAVYFPLDALIVLSHTDPHGRSAGVALAGHEALVGAGLSLGSLMSVHDANVVIDGDALCMPRAALVDALDRDSDFQALMLRYAHALMTQISFNAFCERMHDIEQRLIRWLLLAEDRAPRNGLRLSQETLASMLGVRREGVSVAAGKLQKAAMIRYQRGRIIIVDRGRMEALTCQCYREIRDEYARLFAQSP